MVDVPTLRFLPAALVGWLDRQKQDGLAYLIEENRILRGQLRGRRLRLTDDERRRLAVRGHRLGRRRLYQVATIVTADTILMKPVIGTQLLIDAPEDLEAPRAEVVCVQVGDAPVSLGHVMVGHAQRVEHVATNLRRAGQPKRLHSKVLVVIAWRASPAIC